MTPSYLLSFILIRGVLPLTSLFLAAVACAEQPFEFARTPGKLPKTILPREYALHIVPDVATMTCLASEAIKIDVRMPVREVILNAADLQILTAAVDGKPVATSAITFNSSEETLTLGLGRELSTGPHELTLT